MKLKPIKILPPKLRALIIYDADREIDLVHPLYSEIMLYGEMYEETHVFVCIPGLPFEKQRVVNLSATVFVYYLPGNAIMWRIDDIWPLIRYHLIWQREFRPDVVIIGSTHSGAILGYTLAKRYHKPYFFVTNGAFVDRSLFSPTFLRNFLLARGARGVIVPGQTIVTLLSRFIGSSRLHVVRPAIDMSLLERSSESMQYGILYPKHNVFLLTEILGRYDIAFVTEVFDQVLQHYPRAALIVVVPHGEAVRIKHILGSHLSIYVCEAGDDEIKYYRGAQLFFNVSDREESARSLILALGLHVPTVTVPSTFAKELFTGSRYEQYMKGGTKSFGAEVISLIGNQQARDEYRLNSNMLLQSLTLQTTAGYVAAIVAYIDERVRQ